MFYILLLLFLNKNIEYKIPVSEPIQVEKVTYEKTIIEPIKQSSEEEKVEEESIYCSCILTVRSLGAKLPRGDAKDLKNNSTPTIGGAVILKYGDIYHVAYIQYIFPGAIWVQEGNKERCKFTEREILFTDEHIVGFWSNPI